MQLIAPPKRSTRLLDAMGEVEGGGGEREQKNWLRWTGKIRRHFKNRARPSIARNKPICYDGFRAMPRALLLCPRGVGKRKRSTDSRWDSQCD